MSVMAAIMGALPTWHKYDQDNFWPPRRRRSQLCHTNTHDREEIIRRHDDGERNEVITPFPHRLVCCLFLSYSGFIQPAESSCRPIAHHSTWLVKWCRQQTYRKCWRKIRFFFLLRLTTTAFEMATFYGHGMFGGKDYHCIYIGGGFDNLIVSLFIWRRSGYTHKLRRR
jgi:hypothetical protein